MIETAGGLWELLRLAAAARFRLRGAYLRWRYETAFGGEPPPRWRRLVAILEYGRWVFRMRRLYGMRR